MKGNEVVSDRADSMEKDANNEKQLLATKWAKRVKFAIGLLSFTLFVTQSLSVTFDYLEYKTVVTTELIKPSFLVMPAVTVCSPVPISINRLCHQNESKEECDARLNKQSEIYKPVLLAAYFDKLITNDSLLNLINGDEVLTITRCKIGITIKRVNFTKQREDCKNVTNRVESIIYNKRRADIGQYCQTFFSEFDPMYDKTKLNIDLIEYQNFMASIHVQLKYNDWYPSWYKDRGISIAVHPSNMIPSDTEWKFINILGTRSYLIEYSRTVAKLLEKPYQTMCFDYKTDPKSKSDCIRKCIFDQSFNSDLNCIYQWNVILLSELTKHAKLCPKSSEDEVIYLNTRHRCKNSCESDCVQETYNSRRDIFEENVNIESINESNSTVNKSLSNIAIINIFHRTDNDILITHKEEMVFSTYVANIGGLGGIYLGISVVALYDAIVDFLIWIQKMYRKKLKS